VTGETTPRTRRGEAEAIDVSERCRCSSAETFSDALVGPTPVVASVKSVRCAHGADGRFHRRGPIDGRGAEADDLDGVARLAEFDFLGLSRRAEAPFTRPRVGPAVPRGVKDRALQVNHELQASDKTGDNPSACELAERLELIER